MTCVHEDEGRKINVKKVLLAKKVEKIYKVIITYIQLSDEEAKTKRAIIETIIKKNYYK